MLSLLRLSLVAGGGLAGEARGCEQRDGNRALDSSDNFALMRIIHRHENALQGHITDITKAVMGASSGFGEDIPDEGAMLVMYDGPIIQNVTAEKQDSAR